jgi:ATP-dependent protease HslVU (ClpYQ) peptidase subunit
MTCIVGFSTKGKVYIGGDSAVTGGTDQTVRLNTKVYRVGSCIIGTAGSCRAHDLLQYALVVPDRYSSVTVDHWLRTDFVDAVRSCLKTGGVAAKENETEESPSSFLLGYDGRLFYVGRDYQIGEPMDGYDAAGTGGPYAKGAMAALIKIGGVEPEQMIEIALEAAERNDAAVRRPFTVLTL